MIFRNLKYDDYDNGYLCLLEQLTEVNPEKITFDNFASFINNLNDNHIIIIIEKDNKIIASGTLFIENKIIHGISKVGHLEDIVVDKNTRGLGLGKELITYLYNLAYLEGCYKVILNCKESNCEFYEKCGFEKKEAEMVKYFDI